MVAEVVVAQMAPTSRQISLVMAVVTQVIKVVQTTGMAVVVELDLHRQALME